MRTSVGTSVKFSGVRHWACYKQRYDRLRAEHRQIRLIYRLDFRSILLRVKWLMRNT